MKKILLPILLIFSLLLVSCTKKTEKAADPKPIVNNNQVQVYYFHASRRCATCKAVETVSEKAVRENYGDKVAFQSINIEDEKNNALVQKYQISGQRLLILKGENGFDLTYFAFMNAMNNPDRLKEQIKIFVDSCKGM